MMYFYVSCIPFKLDVIFTETKQYPNPTLSSGNVNQRTIYTYSVEARRKKCEPLWKSTSMCVEIGRMCGDQILKNCHAVQHRPIRYIPATEYIRARDWSDKVDAPLGGAAVAGARQSLLVPPFSFWIPTPCMKHAPVCYLGGTFHAWSQTGGGACFMHGVYSVHRTRHGIASKIYSSASCICICI